MIKSSGEIKTNDLTNDYTATLGGILLQIARLANSQDNASNELNCPATPPTYIYHPYITRGNVPGENENNMINVFPFMNKFHVCLAYQ